MKVEIEVPDYNQETGIKLHWEDGFEIDVRMDDRGVLLVANSAGLKSLANHLLNIAQDAVQSGTHLHFDEFNSLEEGSFELTVEKR